LDDEYPLAQWGPFIHPPWFLQEVGLDINIELKIAEVRFKTRDGVRGPVLPQFNGLIPYGELLCHGPVDWAQTTTNTRPLLDGLYHCLPLSKPKGYPSAPTPAQM
jgi:hypothetical protein